jgi:acyl-CoA synthetase (AMP-forming)/AMP-acid ligase II
VLFWGENSPEWIAAFYGCLLRGAVVVPLDLKSAPDFVERVQQQVSAKLLLADNEQQLNFLVSHSVHLEDVVAKHSNEALFSLTLLSLTTSSRSSSLQALPPNQKASVSHTKSPRQSRAN